MRDLLENSKNKEKLINNKNSIYLTWTKSGNIEEVNEDYVPFKVYPSLTT